MKIRPLELQDVEDLIRIQNQVENRLGFRLNLPPLAIEIEGEMQLNPLIASGVVFLDDDNKPKLATILKKTTESYLLMDRTDKVGHREWFSRFLCVEKASKQHAISQNINETLTFLSPELDKTWGRVLKDVGWYREPFPVYSKRHQNGK